MLDMWIFEKVKNPVLKWLGIYACYAIFCLIFVGIVMGVSGQVSSFYGETNPFNITFVGEDNQTIYLEIPIYGYVDNTSFSYSLDNFSIYHYNMSCYQETANESSSCGGLDSGSYNWTIVDYSALYFCYEGNVTINYTKPTDSFDATWRVKIGDIAEQNVSIPDSCFNCSEDYISVRLISHEGSCLGTSTGYARGACFNGTAWITLIEDIGNGNIGSADETEPSRAFDGNWSSGVSADGIDLWDITTYTGDYDGYLWEEAVFWNITKQNESNIYIYLNDNIIYNLSNNESIDGYQYNISLNITTLNNILLDNCNCTNCSISGTNCLVPLKFYSDTAGTLEVNLTNATYSYGIDNCSNSFNIPSNATSYIFNFQDISDSPININLSHSLLYAGNIYASQSTGISNFSYCIYPNWLNITDDIFLQMYYGSGLFTYFSSGSIFDNVTNYLNFTIDTGTSPITTYVYDESGNSLEEAYIDAQRYDPSTGNYITIGSYATNFEGSVVIPIIKTTTLYRFYIYYPIGTLRESTNPTYINSDTISFYIDTEKDYLEDYFLTQDVYSSLTYNNLTQNLRYEYSDSTASVEQGCLRLYRLQGVGSTLVNSSCNSGASGTILLNVDNISGSTYIGKSFVYIENKEIPIDSLSIHFPTTDAQNTIGLMGLLVDLLVTISFGFIFFFSIPLAIILIPIPTVMLSSIGFLAIDPAIAWGIEVAALVLAFIINKRD